MATESDSESTINLQDPELILLFTWTGAQPHQIEKYTSRYSRLFPSSSIMVITTSINDILYRSSAKQQRHLLPAILTIISSNLESNFLVHCFSESGTHRCVRFAKAFLKTTGRRLPISALCLDSARGTLHSTKTAQAWQESTKGNKPAFHIVTSLLAYTLAASCWTTYPIICDAFIGRSQLQFDKSRQALNNPRLWDVRTPRCYLFSAIDKLTNPSSVIEHARSAEKHGARVILTQFDDDVTDLDTSRPIKSASNNAERYWATIQLTWDTSGSTNTNTGTSTPPPPKSATEVKKPAYIYATDLEKKADIMHVSIHELPTHHSPVDHPTTPEEPILSASSSIYSDADVNHDHDEKEVSVAPAPGPAPASIYSTKEEKSRWHHSLRPTPIPVPVPGYEDYQGAMGIETKSYSYASSRLALTQQRERERELERESSCRDMYQYFYAGL